MSEAICIAVRMMCGAAVLVGGVSAIWFPLRWVGRRMGENSAPGWEFIAGVVGVLGSLLVVLFACMAGHLCYRIGEAILGACR